MGIKKFIAFNENAIRLQILAAMIAFILLRLAHHTTASKLTLHRFTELAGAFIHSRRPLAQIERPPPINPAKPAPKSGPGQIKFQYA